MQYPDLLKRCVVKLPFLLPILEKTGIKRDNEIKTFFKHIHKGNVVYDIGANVGRFTKIFCMLSGQKGRVIAFEPISMNYAKLSKLNFNNLTLYKKALSDQKEVCKIFYPLEDGAQGSLKKQTFGNWNSNKKLGEEVCKVDTLDHIISTHQLPIPHFIKIDAEGAETKILKGGKETLRKNNIILFIELNTETLINFNTTPKEIWDTLQSYGYITFTLVGRKNDFSVHSVDDLTSGLKKHFSPSLLCQK